MAFELDLLSVSVSFVAPIIWLVGQVVALVALRGRLRWFAAVPLAVMLLVIPTTYDAWRAGSNLWPVFFILSSFPSAIAVVAALVIGKPKLSKRFMAMTGIAAAGLVIVAFAHSAAGAHARRSAEQRQSKEADAIIRALDAVVPVGVVQTSDPSAIDPETARDVVTKSGVLYNTCYRQGLALDPHLGGSLVFELGVAADGHVATAVVRQSSGAASVERCIVEALQKLEFPKHAADVTSITIPMQFRPQSTSNHF